MSTNLAMAYPARAPHEVETEPRHIEIVTTRSQRRARPRVVYALVAVAGLFVILIAQLLLSIVLSDGAYQISALQSSQRELSRDQQTLTESLNILQSPQNLAARAEGLGMVVNSSGSGWLRLSDGAVVAAPTAAGAASTVGANASALITNSLLTPDVLASEAATADPATAPGSTAAGTTAPGAPAGTAGAASVPSNSEALPSPVTH